jgi:hypothetical protein
VTAKKSYGSSGLAERILVISVTDQRRQAIIFRLGGAALFGGLF